MPSAKEVAEEVYDLLMNRDGVPVPADWGAPGNDHWKWPSIIASDGNRQRRIEQTLQQMTARDAARDAVLTHLTSGGDLDAASLTAAAEAGADRALAKLADRLNPQDGDA